MRLVVVGITDVVESDTIHILLQGLCNTRISEHARSLQVFLLLTQKSCPGLCSTTGIASGVDIHLRLSLPNRRSLLLAQSHLQQFLICRIINVDGCHYRILCHSIRQGTFLLLLRLQFSAHHRNIYLVGKNISNTLSGSTSRDIDIHFGVKAMKLICPLYRQRIKGESTRQRNVTAQHLLAVSTTFHLSSTSATS